MKKLFNKLLSPFVRFGFVVRGTLYFLTGYYGLLAAVGLQTHAKDVEEIVKILGSILFGQIVLIVIFVGLLGYGVWGFVRAFRANNLISRISCLISGVCYFALCVLPINLLLNKATSSPQWPFNLLIVGLALMVGGMAQIIYGFKKSFEKTLQSMTSGKQKRILLITGKYGYMARGVIFFLLGMSFALGKAPGGSVLLGVTSVGLMALGTYSIIASRVVKMKVNDK